MDLSLQNLACWGIGNGQISYEWPVPGQTVTLPHVVGGGTRWLTDDTVAFQQIVGGALGAVIESQDVSTGTGARLSDTGANLLVARGGEWATISNRGFRSSFGPTTPAQATWFPVDVDDNGDLAVILNGAQNRGLGVWDGQTLVTLSDGSSVGGAFKNGQLVYTVSGQWFSWTRAGGIVSYGALPNVALVDASGGWVLVYRGGIGIAVLPLWQPAHAILVSADAENFYPKIRAFDPLLQIAVSRGAGELPTDLRRHVVDLTAHTVDGLPWQIVDMRHDPPGPEPPIPPIPPVVPFLERGKALPRYA